MTPNQPKPHDPIDQVLHALAHTEPPTGMDARILHALESHTLQPATTTPRRWLHWKPVLVLTTAAAGVLLALAISPVPHLRPGFIGRKVGIGDAHPSTALNPRKTPSTAHLEPAPIPSVPHLRSGFIGPKVGIGEADSSLALRTRKTLSTTTTKPETSSTTLVSFPAPPMPLTTQEKLLLRIAHKDDPQELAPLTPAGRAAEQAQDRAAFEDFFPPPIPIEYPTLISQSNPPAPTPGASK